MQRDIDFAIWCAHKCLHLCNAPQKVNDWLENPKTETIAAALASKAAAAEAVSVSWEAREAVIWAANAAIWAAKALDTTVTDLKLEYVKTWTSKELAQADDDWIEVATVEILNRM